MLTGYHEHSYIYGVGIRYHAVADQIIYCGNAGIEDVLLEMIINMIVFLAWMEFSGRPKGTGCTACLELVSGRHNQGPVHIPKHHVLSSRSISKSRLGRDRP
jgi:hypothetical protein